MSGNLGRIRFPKSFQMAWQRLRGYQNDEVASIERYTLSGGDDAAAIAPTRTLVTGLDDLPVIVQDFTERIAKELGMDWIAGRKVFMFLPDSTAKKVIRTDFILWTKQGETDISRWKPDQIEMMNMGSSFSACAVVAHREPRP